MLAGSDKSACTAVSAGCASNSQAELKCATTCQAWCRKCCARVLPNRRPAPVMNMRLLIVPATVVVRADNRVLPAWPGGIHPRYRPWREYQYQWFGLWFSGPDFSVHGLILLQYVAAAVSMGRAINPTPAPIIDCRIHNERCRPPAVWSPRVIARKCAPDERVR